MQASGNSGATQTEWLAYDVDYNNTHEKKNPFSPCCFKHFTWDGTPSGIETTLAGNPTYVTSPSSNSPSSNSPSSTTTHSAVLYIHDGLTWKFSNARLLADHFAREANVTVYMPDFFGGERLDEQAIKEGRWDDIDMAGFQERNTWEIREPEIFACARELRGQYKKLGTVGYCWGGWAVLRLAAKEHKPPLVDCIVCAHPSWVTKEDIDGVGNVPVQVLQPEIDNMFNDELKMYAFQKLVVEKKGDDSIPVDYVHFPRVSHGVLTKGDDHGNGDRDAAVAWFKQWLGE